MAHKAPDELMMAAGLAGWALCGSLMIHLHEKGLLSQSEGIAIIDHALSGLETIAAVGEHASLRAARMLLENEMKTWAGATDRSPGSR